jgi:hypothetical protein
MPFGAMRHGFTFQPTAAEEAARTTPVTITTVNDAQVDTAQSQFGGASAYFDGTGDLLQASAAASLTIPSSEDFTIEGWIRPGSVSGTPALLTDRASSTSLWWSKLGYFNLQWQLSCIKNGYFIIRDR